MGDPRNGQVVIVGAGLAGLACALRLQEARVPFRILEASDAPGGRVRTDAVHGFLLDRGFQVLPTAYEEARRVLDFEALALRRFRPGALVRHRGRFHRLADPWRDPLGALATILSRVGTLRDKLRISRLRGDLLAGEPGAEWSRPETTTREALAARGFSDRIVESFFRPFLGGIFLESDLETSSRMFEFVFRMFAAGEAAVPSGGMGAIPAQLASRLPAGSIRLGARVDRIAEDAVCLQGGERIPARQVIVATEGAEASRLLPGVPCPHGHAVTCLYFAAEEDPVGAPILVLNGEGGGLVNHLASMSRVAPSYAPPGQTLLSVTVLGDPPLSDPRLEEAVRVEMTLWFGSAVRNWCRVGLHRIPCALPAQPPRTLDPPARPARLRPGLFVCGDHRENASIEGALRSGRRAAEAALDDRSPP